MLQHKNDQQGAHFTINVFPSTAEDKKQDKKSSADIYSWIND